MRASVDQGRALKRARQAAWAFAAFSCLLVGLVALDLALDSSPGLVYAGAMLTILIVLAMTNHQVGRLAERYGLRETHVHVVDADRAVAALSKHFRRWWAVHVSDARKWRSSYDDADAVPAPLRLPFEVQGGGRELVLRGSAIHVEAAVKYLRRSGRAE